MTAPSRIRPATRGDIPEIVDLLNACDVAEIGEPDSTPEDLENDWAMEGFDPARDAWVAEGPQGLVGYAYAGDQFRTGELEADLWVHPEHYEPELAGTPARARRAPSGRARRRAWLRGADARRLLPGRPTAPSATCCARTVTSSRAPCTGCRWTSAGACRRPSPPRRPRALEIRTFRPGIDEQVMFETMHDAFVDHFRQSDEPFEAWKTRLLGHPNFLPELWWLAWDDAAGEAAGGVIAYDHGDLGWIQGLGVRRPWRRRGLGAALLAHALAAFGARGQSRVDLGVDAEGATRPLRLYERAGMQASAAYELFTKPLV